MSPYFDGQMDIRMKFPFLLLWPWPMRRKRKESEISSWMTPRKPWGSTQLKICVLREIFSRCAGDDASRRERRLRCPLFYSFEPNSDFQNPFLGEGVDSSPVS